MQIVGEVKATVTGVDKDESGQVKSVLVTTAEGHLGRIHSWRYNPLVHTDPLNVGDLLFVVKAVDSRTLMVTRADDDLIWQEIQTECAQNQGESLVLLLYLKSLVHLNKSIEGVQTVW